MKKGYVFLFVFIIILTGCSNANTKQDSSELTLDTSIEEKSKTENKEEETIDYEVIYTLTNKRFDKGINYYVLLPPIDPAEPKFIGEIKLIIDELVKKHGGKISIDFYDDIEILELEYKLYGDMTLVRNTTEEENKQLARHNIAGFSGELTTGVFLNSLYIFPNADYDFEFKDLSSCEEYNPKQ